MTPDDELALQTQLQLLLALERYPLALQSPQATPLEKAYALYKSSRPNEAKAILQVDEIDLEEDRAAKVVLAQVVRFISLSLSVPSRNQLISLRTYRIIVSGTTKRAEMHSTTWLIPQTSYVLLVLVSTLFPETDPLSLTHPRTLPSSTTCNTTPRPALLTSRSCLRSLPSLPQPRLRSKTSNLIHSLSSSFCSSFPSYRFLLDLESHLFVHYR